MTTDITHADYPRFEAYLPVECAAPISGRPSARLIVGKTRFVSAAGLEILMPETLPLRTPMTVRVAQGDPLRAHVVWADQGTPTPAGTRVSHGVLFEQPVDPALVNHWVYRCERQAYSPAPLQPAEPLAPLLDARPRGMEPQGRDKARRTQRDGGPVSRPQATRGRLDRRPRRSPVQ